MQFNIADLFECVAGHVPDRVAVVCDNRRLTYRELDDRSSRLADALVNLGVGPGTHVGLYLYNDLEHLEAMLACYKRRAVPVNVNYRYVADELRYVLDDAEIEVLFFNRELRSEVAAVRGDVPGLHHVVEVPGPDAPEALGDGNAAPALGALAYDDVLASGHRTEPIERSSDDHYILYTGGTTGSPKGVVWRHEDIFFAALGGGNPGGPPIAEPEQIGRSVVENPNQRLAPFLSRGDPGPGCLVALSLGPLVHASGQWGALGTLLGGGTLVLNPDRHVDMGRVLDLVQREHIGMITLVGDTSARPLLDALDAERGSDGAHDTSSLLLLGSGGSILSADVKTKLLAALPTVAGILEAIGSSESPAQAVAVATPDTPASESLTFASKPETMVVDDDLHRVPTGSVGRLATRGRVPLGYWKDPERTARTFVEIDGERWALPGDMARVDADGTIHLLGRGSLCINTGGEKVYPEEVEAVLKTHAGVADAVVVGAPDEQWGNQVVAVVSAVPSAGELTLGALQAHCRERLAGYKVPRALHVVDEVHRSPSGKADYRWAQDVASTP